jgi:ribbon-helix-helix CopG family protein
MNRTTLSLPEDLVFVLRREARRRHLSLSAVVREALAERFDVGATGPREIPFAAVGRSDDGRGGREADEMLEKIFEAKSRRIKDEHRGR